MPGTRMKDGKTLEPAVPLQPLLLGKPCMFFLMSTDHSCYWKSVH